MAQLQQQAGSAKWSKHSNNALQGWTGESYGCQEGSVLGGGGVTGGDDWRSNWQHGMTADSQALEERTKEQSTRNRTRPGRATLQARIAQKSQLRIDATGDWEREMERIGKAGPSKEELLTPEERLARKKLRRAERARRRELCEQRARRERGHEVQDADSEDDDLSETDSSASSCSSSGESAEGGSLDPEKRELRRIRKKRMKELKKRQLGQTGGSGKDFLRGKSAAAKHSGLFCDLKHISKEDFVREVNESSTRKLLLRAATEANQDSSRSVVYSWVLGPSSAGTAKSSAAVSNPTGDKLTAERFGNEGRGAREAGTILEDDEESSTAVCSPTLPVVVLVTSDTAGASSDRKKPASAGAEAEQQRNADDRCEQLKTLLYRFAQQHNGACIRESLAQGPGRALAKRAGGAAHDGGGDSSDEDVVEGGSGKASASVPLPVKLVFGPASDLLGAGFPPTALPALFVYMEGKCQAQIFAQQIFPLLAVDVFLKAAEAQAAAGGSGSGADGGKSQKRNDEHQQMLKVAMQLTNLKGLLTQSGVCFEKSSWKELGVGT